MALLVVASWISGAVPPPPSFREYPPPTANSGTWALATGSDGAIWFTEHGANNIARICTTATVPTCPVGTFNEYPVPTANSYVGEAITVGVDGAMWFTEYSADNIGRICTAATAPACTVGSITEYPVPTPNAGPNGITSGPDGALWFTESSAGKIGRLTTSGVFTEFRQSGISAGANITTGPDGALWFVADGNDIGRITTGNNPTITSYPTETPGGAIGGLTLGPDGALWFTAPYGGSVGRMTATGVVNWYGVPTASTEPNGIVTGPDGAVWFTEAQANNIGRITTGASKVVTEYPIPTPNSEPLYIEAGPDGALWFTEATATKVSQVVLGHLPARVNRLQQAAPISLGTSGGNVNDFSATACCSGTLGSLVQDVSGNTYVLSNNHVLALSNAGHVGDAISQTGLIDNGCTMNNTLTVAQLSQFVPLNFSGTNSMDAAIAQTVPGMVNTSGKILTIGTVSSATVAPKLGMRVEKSGRTTGTTSGSIDAVNVTAVVGGYGPCGTGSQSAKFVHQFLVIPGTTFVQPGDSGSLIVRTAGSGSANPVGLLFAKSPTSAIANAANAVAAQFGVTFVGKAPTPSDLMAAAETVDPRVEAASRIKDRNDAFLMGLPEVVGHGVGYSQGGSGEVVIRLFLRKATDAARHAAPSSLEGVPVEIQETGDFRVIPCRGTR